MRVSEIYESTQGEGFLTGTRSVFVRASGCNLRCWFCDTPYASWQPEGDDFSVDEIVDQVSRFPCRHVVLTGGEPMLFAELIPLSERLHDLGYHITIETAGTLFLPVACDLMSISPKLSNSVPEPTQSPRWHKRHQRTQFAADVVQRLVADYRYQVKFVVSTQDDVAEVQRYLDKLPQIARSSVMLMPMGTDVTALAEVAEWLQPYCVQAGLHFCARRQIEWFGSVRGT
jgi:7-carboxy-7-deazaguanine synthase